MSNLESRIQALEHRIGALEREIGQMEKMVEDMHRALIDPPAGGGQPFIVELRELNREIRNGQWAVSWIVRSLLVLGGLGSLAWVVSVLRGVP